MRAVRDALLQHRAAERFCECGGLRKRITLHDLVANDDDRLLCLENARGERFQNFIRRAHAAIDTRRRPEIDSAFEIENIAR